MKQPYLTLQKYAVEILPFVLKGTGDFSRCTRERHAIVIYNVMMMHAF